MLLILSVFTLLIIVFRFNYKKKNKKVLTINKLTFLGVMLGLAIILNYISFSFGVPGQSVEISFDYIPILIVGFLLGPLEGILFGVLTDSILVLLNGYAWNFFLAVQKPILGLIGAGAAYIYHNEKFKISNFTKIFILETSLFSLSITSIVLLSLSNPEEYSKALVGSILFILIVSVLIVNVIFYFIYKNDKKNLDIFVISMMMVLISRLINSLILTPIGMQILYGHEFIVSLLPRVVTMSFWAPINGLLIYYLLKGLGPKIDRLFDVENKWS